MQINELFEAAKSFSDKIKEERPHYAADPNTTLCVIVTDTQDLYTAVSGIKITANGIETVPAEFNAIMSMIYDSKAKAEQMAIITISDQTLRMPSDECLDFLLRIEQTNSDCVIHAEPGKTISIGDLKTVFAPTSETLFGSSATAAETEISSEETSGEETASEEKASGSDLGVPADFVSGFDFDESNPFYEPESTEDPEGSPPPVQAITDKPVNPYADAMMNGGFPQQQMGGFPQQPMGGYPQQPYQQPMGGYPQQPYQQPMGGYPQQPYQQPMGGYPQQPYQQPMGGYPQQPYQQMGGYSQPFNAAPYSGNAGTASVYSQPYQSQNADISDEDNDGGVMKQRLASLLGNSQKASEPTLSKEEMLKKAKEMKKAARQNEKMKKQF